jgi:RNA polymerase sigma-70 factor (ECF subfamily)
MSTQEKMLPNESELVSRSKAGDSAAFGVLYDGYIKHIYNFIFFKTHHKETAEDLTSRTFFKALKSIQSADPSKSFLSWLYKIAQNTVIDHYRRWSKNEAKRQNIDDAWDISDTTDIVADVDTSQEVEKIKKLLAGFTSLERDIVIMRIWQDLSYKEISVILGKSEASCKMTYSRTIKKLKDLVPVSLLLILLAHL